MNPLNGKFPRKICQGINFLIIITNNILLNFERKFELDESLQFKQKLNLIKVPKMFSIVNKQRVFARFLTQNLHE